MKKVLILVGLLLSVVPSSFAADAGDARLFLNRYCTTCHNDQLKTAGLTLQTFDSSVVAQQAPALEKA